MGCHSTPLYKQKTFSLHPQLPSVVHWFTAWPYEHRSSNTMHHRPQWTGRARSCTRSAHPDSRRRGLQPRSVCGGAVPWPLAAHSHLQRRVPHLQRAGTCPCPCCSLLVMACFSNAASCSPMSLCMPSLPWFQINMPVFGTEEEPSPSALYENDDVSLGAAWGVTSSQWLHSVLVPAASADPLSARAPDLIHPRAHTCFMC